MGIPGIVKSNYRGSSICNILPSLAKIFSIKPKDKILRTSLLPQLHQALEKAVLHSKRIVILEIDRLGFDRLAKIRKRFSFLNQNVFKITSTFPTYTHPALTSFITGTPPATHGLVSGTFKLGEKIRWVGEISTRERENLILADSLL